MKKGTGLWIDHSMAVVIKITGNTSETEKIFSDAEKQLRRTGDSIMKGSFESKMVPVDDRQQTALTEKRNNYFDKIIESVRDAGPILIFGPVRQRVNL